MNFAKAEGGKGQFCSGLMLHVTLNAIVFKFSFLKSEQHVVMNDDVNDNINDNNNDDDYDYCKKNDDDAVVR